MNYATYQQLLDAKGREELIVLTDRDNTGEPNEAVALGALDDASRAIDGYLTHKYALPLASAPAVLRRHCIDIAVYYLAGSHSRLTEDIETRHSSAIRYLEQLAAGKVGLGISEPSDGVVDGADGSEDVMFDAPADRLMTRDRLQGM